jgi:hypothetical protein
VARAIFEIRVIPLIAGVPDLLENDSGGTTSIEEEDTILLSQFTDVEVVHELNEGRTAAVTLSHHDPATASIVAAYGDDPEYKLGLWVGYRRPGSSIAEGVFCGQASVRDDFARGAFVLEAADPATKARHHFVRRGDEVLNIDGERGRVRDHAWSLTEILDCARNTVEQQARAMPALALAEAFNDDFGGTAAYNASPLIDFERFQEVWDLCLQIIGSAVGPDIDVVPAWFWPVAHYATLWVHPPSDDPLALDPQGLGRNLDPADPDDPDADEVVFDFGMGNDALADTERTPGVPNTHVHVVDADKAYRETAADATSSGDRGAWVNVIETDYSIKRPGTGATVNTDSLRAIADAQVRAYGSPPPFTAPRLRPDDAQARHYGHPSWAGSVPVGVEYTAGDYYIGDWLRYRATRGNRVVSQLARLTKVTFSQRGSNGLVQVDHDVVPAVGSPGDNEDETES